MFRSSVLTLALAFGALAAMPTRAQTVPANTSNTTEKATLTVSVSGVRNDKGQVLIWVWNGPDGFPKKGDKSYKVASIDANKAVNGIVTTKFELSPGNFAVTTLHDENKNGEMDTNAFGIPKEGYGASNNVVIHLHAPSFEQAKFQVPVSCQKISISMRY
jgi:uncharacterized protein (DUF2141 family)